MKPVFMIAAVALAANCAFAQQAPGRGNYPGRGGDPNYCAAPTGMGAAN